MIIRKKSNKINVFYDVHETWDYNSSIITINFKKKKYWKTAHSNWIYSVIRLWWVSSLKFGATFWTFPGCFHTLIETFWRMETVFSYLDLNTWPLSHFFLQVAGNQTFPLQTINDAQIHTQMFQTMTIVQLISGYDTKTGYDENHITFCNVFVAIWIYRIQIIDCLRFLKRKKLIKIY